MLEIEKIENTQHENTANIALPYIPQWETGAERTVKCVKRQKRHLKKHIKEKLDFACTLLILVQMTFWVWIVLAIF